MEAPFDFSDFSRRLEEKFDSCLGPGKSTDLIGAARRMQRAAEDALGHRPHPNRAACGPGCGHCCVVNVSVLNPEADLVVDYLQRNFSPSRREALRERLRDLYRKIRWIEDEDRPLLRESCAFLDRRQHCSIHPVRPLLCRAMTSTDPDRCREAIALQALGESPTVLSDLFQARLFREAFITLGRCLERAGLEARSGTLTEIVLRRLEA